MDRLRGPATSGGVERHRTPREHVIDTADAATGPGGSPPGDADDSRLADAVALARQAAGERDAALARVRQLERELVHAAAVHGAETRHVDALASHAWHLQRQVVDLLGSRRWAMGRRLGDLVDALLRRHRAVREDDRIRQLVDDGRRVLGALNEERVRQSSARGRTAAGHLPGAGRPDLHEFLRRAAVDPLAETPFDETVRHAVACMEAHRDHLVARRDRRARGPLVSVVMPTYQRAHLLPRAVGSVLAQSYEHWELIVADDGSTDGTASVLASYDDERIVTLALEGNHGVSRARNRALERARGDVVAYLDSDNYWHEHFLLLMVGALEDRPGRESAYCAQEIWEVVRAAGAAAVEPERRLDGIRFAPFNRALLENRNFVDLNAFVHRRTLLERHGAFDESLPRLVDWDLFLRYTVDSRPVALPCLLSSYEFGTAKDQLTRTLPVRPATEAIDASTLRRTLLEVTLPRETAARYPRPVLFAPLGEPRSGRPRPVTVAVAAPSGGFALRATLDAVRAGAPGADLRFVLQDGTTGAARSEVDQAAADPDVAVVGAAGGAWWRAALEAAGGRDVVLLDAEVVVVPGWLEACWEVLDAVGDAGLVVPRVTLLPDAPGFGLHVPFAKTYREVDVSLSLADGNVSDPWFDDERGLVELTWARFTCAYLPATSLAAAGPPPPLDDAAEAARVYGDLLRTLAARRVLYTPHGKVYHLP